MNKVHCTNCHDVTEGLVEVKLYSFFNIVARCGWVVNATPQPLYPIDRNPVPIVQEAGWVTEPVWTGVENLTPIGIRSPDRPARNKPL
jgi:hypothetical protein